MSWERIFVVILVGMGACADSTNARAQQFRSIDQMPGLINSDSAKIIIANISTVALNISYLDGASHSIQIPSGQYVSLPSHNTGLLVSFNDGHEAKSVTLNPNITYALYWNSALDRWAIAPYDDVARRPSGFRSR
jgi:hypothetical protein